MSEENAKKYVLSQYCYYDKFLNRFSGARTYQLGLGIPHLYSTRDYYEMKGDYWRVRKSETKVIYRVTLSEKWMSQFKLKHTSTEQNWPYDHIPSNVEPGYTKAKLITNFDIDDEGLATEVSRTAVFYYGYSQLIFGVDKEGYKLNSKEVCVNKK